MADINKLIADTFNTLGSNATSGWVKPSYQSGMMGRGLPTDRLIPGTAGLPNPSPGSGLTPEQLAGMGGWTVDPQTGALAYAPSSPGNPAVTAATDLGGGVSLPRRRPGYAPTTIDMAAIKGLPKKDQGGLLEMLFGGGGESTPTVNNGTVRRAVGTNGYIYGQGANGKWYQQDKTDRTAQGLAIGNANRRNPNPTYNVSGSNNAFEPKSVQNSERWQTGY